MKLAHYPHQHGRAEIVDTDDTDKTVGYSRRQPFPLGGYIFEITATDGTGVYKGNSMASGMAALEAHIARARGHRDCCLSETDDCNWPACGCDEPRPLSRATAGTSEGQ